MPVETSEIVWLTLCFILSGFFSGSEAVLMSVGIDRARQLIEEGGSKGKALTFMVDNPNELLTTILIGNNIVNIFAASLTTSITARLFDSDVIGISVGFTTFIILIFGEIIPKTFARTNAENLSVFVIRVLQTTYYLMFPIVNGTVWLIQKVLGDNAQINGRLITHDEIEYMVQKAEKENTMDSKQLDLLNSILEFPKIKVKDIMIPRQKIKYLDIAQSYEEIINTIQTDTHSRYPVCDDELENTIGFLHVKSLAFLSDKQKASFNIKEYLKDDFFVYEHMKIQSVFDHMNRKKVHLALVKDENNIVVGIVTLEDIVEEVLGEIQDEHDMDEAHITNEYNESDLEVGVTVEGTISLRDLYTDYDIKIPLNDNYSTVAGFILDMLGNNFPQEGQIIVWEGYTFELSVVDEYEIREILIKDVDGEKHLFSKKEATESQGQSGEEQTSSNDEFVDFPAK